MIWWYLRFTRTLILSIKAFCKKISLLPAISRSEFKEKNMNILKRHRDYFCTFLYLEEIICNYETSNGSGQGSVSLQRDSFPCPFLSHFVLSAKYKTVQAAALRMIMLKLNMVNQENIPNKSNYISNRKLWKYKVN